MIKIVVTTRKEVATADETRRDVGTHFADYLATLTGSAAHRKDTTRCLERLASSLNWLTLADLTRDSLERWLADEMRAGRSARSRNSFHVAANAFAGWCVKAGRLTSNPFAKLAKANLDADRRRLRRALTADELSRLIQAAQDAPKRPLRRHAEGDGGFPVRPAERLSGHDRGLLYAFLAGTGLRLEEVRRLKVADLDLDAVVPMIRLRAATTKNRRMDTLPIRPDLVAMLRDQVRGRKAGDPVFEVPADLIKQFHADCRRAGIPRFDDTGLRIDLHALRLTYGTHLAAAGVPLATTQKLMRHSDPKLTSNIYVDPRLLDLAGTVDKMPRPDLPAPASVVLKVVAKVVPTQRPDCLPLALPVANRKSRRHA